jgi:hypothetical protein
LSHFHPHLANTLFIRYHQHVQQTLFFSTDGDVMELRNLIRSLPPQTRRRLNAVIGLCQYCEKPVTKFGGTLDTEQRARHHRCWKIICWSQTRSAEVNENFLSIVTYLAMFLGPEDRDALRSIVQSMPQPPSWANVLALLKQVHPLVEASTLNEDKRKAILAHLGAYRSRILKSGGLI